MSKYQLDWNNLLQDLCPSCGEHWSEEGDKYICHNHQQRFSIHSFKVAKIKRDLLQREEMRPTSGWNSED